MAITKNELHAIESLPQVIKDYLPTFLENRLKDILALKLAIDGRDAMAITAICHNIYGVASSYAMQELANEAKALSALAKGAEYALALSKLEKMEIYIKSVQSHL